MGTDSPDCRLNPDPSSKKLLVYLISLQPAALLCAAWLVFVQRAASGPAQACAALLVCTCALARLYLRYRQQPAARTIAELNHETRRLAARIHGAQDQIRTAGRARDRLADAERRELADGLRALQDAHLRTGLAAAAIVDAEIPGFSPSLKTFLAEQGFVCASDIGAMELLSVRGLGEARSQALLVWRNQVLARLNETKPAALPARRVAALHRTFDRQHAANDAAQEDARRRRVADEANLAHVGLRLSELAELGFLGFLRANLPGGKRSGFSLAALLAGQVGLLICMLFGGLSLAHGLTTLPHTRLQTRMPERLVVVMDRPNTRTSPPQPSASRTLFTTQTPRVEAQIPTRSHTAGATHAHRATATRPTATLAPSQTPRPGRTPQPSRTPSPGERDRQAPFQELVELTSPVKPGAAVTITVRTNPGVACVIRVILKSGPSKAKALAPVSAGPDGICTWNWKVSSRTAPGTWSIVIKTGDIEQKYPFVVE